MSKSVGRVAREVERRFDAQAGPVAEFFVIVCEDMRDPGKYHWKARMGEAPGMDPGWREIFTVFGRMAPLALFDKARRECERRKMHVPGLTMVQDR